MPAPAHRARDRGSVAVELVLAAPLLVILLLLAVAAGRLVHARLIVDSAARQAARAASLARTSTTAVSDASATAQGALTGQGFTCADLTVNTSTSNFQAGGDVTVQVSCTVRLSDLGLLKVPGSETLTSTFVSPIDVYRGTATP